MNIGIRIFGVALMAAGAACAAPAAKEPAINTVAAVKDARIGPEVNSICFRQSINNWSTVKGEDDVILLERGVNNWYRVELLGACNESVLKFARTIAIRDRSASSCLRRGDTILVEDTPARSRNCSVRRIYEWDEDAPAPEEVEVATSE